MKYSLIILSCFLSIALFAQEKSSLSDVPFKDRLFYGGNIGLNFGTVTYIYLAPTIGYKITDKLGAGVGPSYSYLNDKRYANYYYETSTYGGRVFAQYKVHPQVLLYGEYEVINAEVPNLNQSKLIRTNIESLLLGGGYVTPINDHSSFVIMGLWNFSSSIYTIYENPIIRAGVNLGF
ncbi:MAG: hypothetical protein ACKOX3_10855 [Bacteroidota bacterium]